MEDSDMRTSCFRIVLLMALCTLCLVVAAALAGTPQAPAAPQPVPSVAQFLATLSAGPSEAPVTELLPPAPKLLSTICHTNADCGPNELCCYPCGIPDCNFVCEKVKRCPLLP
jgi:hypothetical protein